MKKFIIKQKEEGGEERGEEQKEEEKKKEEKSTDLLVWEGVGALRIIFTSEDQCEIELDNKWNFFGSAPFPAVYSKSSLHFA